MSEVDVSNPTEYLHSLDSLARFYNSQITVHVGYLASSFVALIGVFALTREWLSSLILLLFPALERFWAESAVLVIDCLVFLLYVFADWRVCLKYLHARVLYYQALSELVWDHMGTTYAMRSAYAIQKLKERAVGTNGIGIIEAIHSLFEARLSVSLWHRRHPNVDLSLPQNEALRKQLQEKLRNIERFAVTDTAVCWVGHTYYAQPAPLLRFWNRADLLFLADSYALKGYREDVREYVELLEG